MFRNRSQQLQEKYSRIFGNSSTAKSMVDFFVKRLTGEISDTELETNMNALQKEVELIFETTPEPYLPGTVPVGETIYGRIISQDILEIENPDEHTIPQ